MTECECKTWCRDGLPPFTEHHRNCQNRNLEAESVALVSALVKGIKSWAADSDGVHPDVWDAYQKALVFVGDFKKLTSNLPIPKAVYPCNYCAADFSWPPEDLRWSEKIEAWVCSMCWDNDTHGEPKQTLAEVLSGSEKK